MNCQGTAFETAVNIMNPLAQRKRNSKQDDFDRILTDANRSKTKNGKPMAEKHHVKNHEKEDEKTISVEKDDEDCERSIEAGTQCINGNNISMSILTTFDETGKETEGKLDCGLNGEQNKGQRLQKTIGINVDRKRTAVFSTEDILERRVNLSGNDGDVKPEEATSPNEDKMDLPLLEKLHREEGLTGLADISLNSADNENRASNISGSDLKNQKLTGLNTEGQKKTLDESVVGKSDFEASDGKTGFEMDEYFSGNKGIVPEEIDTSTETNKMFEEESGAEIKELEQSDLESSSKDISGSEKAPDYSGNGIIGQEKSTETNGTVGESQKLSKASLVEQMSKSMETGTDGDKKFVRINLKPHWFGEMSIELVKSPEGITARISAEKDVVGHLLADSSREITALFEEKNIKVENIVLEAKESSEQQGYYSGGEGEGFSEGSGRGFSQGRNVYGNMEPSGIIKKEAEEASVLAAQGEMENRINGKGINIIV